MSYALFSQLEYWISDAVALTLGLRYEKTKREFRRHFIDFNGDTNYADVATTWGRMLPKFSLSYYINSKAQVYANYAEGYRSGGYNYRSVGSNPLPYDEESTQSFELGYKNNLHNALVINGALFYNLIKNLRVVTFADDLSTSVKNVDEAYSYGGELDISYEPNEKLTLFSNLGFTKGKMKKLSATDTKYKGNNIIDVPAFTASIGGKYTFIKNFYLQSDFRYLGQRYYDIANNAKESGYEVVNAGLGFEKKSYKALLYVNNLLEKSMLII
jgi:iron complex outermembrane receptor protein